MHKRNRRASSLVITLCFLVIISVAVVAFLTQAALNRQLSFSSAGQLRAQMLADTVQQVIVNDLREEIRAGSTNLSSGTNALYFPLTNTTAVPFRNVADTLTNLVKISRAGEALWSGSAYASNGPVRAGLANKVPTTTAAANGRYMKAERWNRPYLLGSTLPPTFVSPDWLLITRNGPVSGTEPAIATLRDRDFANTNAVIGRYAYAIYDIGGLVDINVAGNNLSATNNAHRGRLHQADLSRIPGIASAGAIVDWRSPTTSTNEALLNSPTNAFLKVPTGDQRFISRQDLIQYVQQHPTAATPEALQYLTTFSREVNAPTFRSKTVTASNPVVPGIVRADGEPVMKRRFPLDRLALLTPTATAGTSSPIYEYFGLSRGNPNSPWVYNHGTAGRILTLAEVAQQNRAPDFFEVLKSVIAEGSLGKTAGNPADPSKDTAFRTAHLDANLDRQVIRIGANIIDQYDGDSWPTGIEFEVNGLASLESGIENLPYINRFFNTAYRPEINPDRDELYSWYEFEVWNPHQAPVASPADAPTSLRITATGGEAYSSLRRNSTSSDVKGPVQIFSPGMRWIEFANSLYTEPTLLTGLNSSCDSPSPDSINLSGIFVGTVNIAGISETTDYGNAGAMPQNLPTFELQYKTPGGAWVTYQKMANVLQPNRTGHGGTRYKALSPNRGYYFRGDPRNVRFGAGNGDSIAPGASMRGMDNSTYPFKQNEGKFTVNGPLATNPGWTVLRTAAPTHARLTALANNDASASTSYLDPDGERRIADGGLRGAAENPLEPNNMVARPLVLNRPFRSVGEMSYAFRDEPWKTLNFFSSNSADAGLLDVFSLDDSEVVAGKINLNTRQPAVLESMLAGAARREYTPSDTILSAQTSDVAASLVAATKARPFINKSDLVTSFSSLAIDASWPAIKTEREAVVRALAETGNLRTWNLLIDFVVQVGRFTPTGTKYSDFLVEGERRYWLHLALDRYTGKVVDQQLEAVNE